MGTFSDASTLELTTSDAPSSVSVDATGVAKGLAVGSANITRP